MNQSKNDANSKRATFKPFLPRALVGLVLRAIVGLTIGIDIATLIGSFLVKTSVLILDTASILVGLFVIVLCTLRGAVFVTYAAIRLIHGAKYR